MPQIEGYHQTGRLTRAWVTKVDGRWLAYRVDKNGKPLYQIELSKVHQ